jgi:hypothetical protein
MERMDDANETMTYPGDGGGESLPDLCLRLHAGQMMTWPLLAENSVALASVWELAFGLDGGTVNVVFNPGRSTYQGERIRPPWPAACFLSGNRPRSRRASVSRRMVDPLQPYPIFPWPLTVVHRDTASRMPVILGVPAGPVPGSPRSGPCFSTGRSLGLRSATYTPGVPSGALPVETPPVRLESENGAQRRESFCLAGPTRQAASDLEGDRDERIRDPAEIIDALERVPPAPESP